MTSVARRSPLELDDLVARKVGRHAKVEDGGACSGCYVKDRRRGLIEFKNAHSYLV